jgi:hypothetical protein
VGFRLVSDESNRTLLTGGRCSEVVFKAGLTNCFPFYSQLKEEYNKKLIIGLLASISNLPGVLLPKEQVLKCLCFISSNLGMNSQTLKEKHILASDPKIVLDY